MVTARVAVGLLLVSHGDRRELVLASVSRKPPETTGLTPVSRAFEELPICRQGRGVNVLAGSSVLGRMARFRILA